MMLLDFRSWNKNIASRAVNSIFSALELMEFKLFIGISLQISYFSIFIIIN
jgi:hypothetical protein